MNLKYIVIILAIVSVLLISGCKSGPVSCDDGDSCTQDSFDSNLKECVNSGIVPCTGNGVCEEGEYGSSDDCPNCDDTDECTANVFDYNQQECVYRPLIKPENWESLIVSSRFFGENLVKNNMNVISCFFEEDVDPNEYVNLVKDFSKFTFVCSADTPQNKVTCSVGDEDFNPHLLFLFMRKDGDLWKVAKIEDSDNILK